MSKQTRHSGYTAAMFNLWAGPGFAFGLFVLGLFLTPWTVKTFYFDPLCQHYAGEQKATFFSGFVQGSRRGMQTAPPHGNADNHSATVYELGGPAAWVMYPLLTLGAPFVAFAAAFAGSYLLKPLGSLFDRLRQSLPHHRGRIS